MKIECVYEKEYCCDDMKNLIIDHENVMNYKVYYFKEVINGFFKKRKRENT